MGAPTEAFTSDRSGLLPLLLADGTTNYVYGPDGSPLEQVNGSGTALFYLHDQQQSTRLLVNSSGAVQASYTYDAYGNVIGQTGAAANPFGYDGQFTDSESGLIYLRARYYDPTTAQFLVVDSARADINPYRYAGQNPLSLGDPSGLYENHWFSIEFDYGISKSYGPVGFDASQKGFNLNGGLSYGVPINEIGTSLDFGFRASTNGDVYTEIALSQGIPLASSIEPWLPKLAS